MRSQRIGRVRAAVSRGYASGWPVTGRYRRILLICLIRGSRPIEAAQDRLAVIAQLRQETNSGGSVVRVEHVTRGKVHALACRRPTDIKPALVDANHQLIERNDAGKRHSRSEEHTSELQ